MITAETLRLRPAREKVHESAGRANWLAPAAAGIFAGAGLFDLLPSAFASVGSQAFIWAATGFGLMMLGATLSSSTDRTWIGWAAGLGIWLHSILEGVVAATGYGVSLTAGIVVSVGLIVHLVPESLALFALQTGTGISYRKALIGCAMPWALVLAGFAASQFLMPGVPPASLGSAMAFGAGAFVSLAGLSWGQRTGSPLRNALIAAIGILWVAAHHLV
jgi:zinc transporter ZupT